MYISYLGFYHVQQELRLIWLLLSSLSDVTLRVCHERTVLYCTVLYSIINEGQGWRPAITIKQMLVGIHDLLDTPNPDDPAQEEAHTLFV